VCVFYRKRNEDEEFLEKLYIYIMHVNSKHNKSFVSSEKRLYVLMFFFCSQSLSCLGNKLKVFQKAVFGTFDEE